MDEERTFVELVLEHDPKVLASKAGVCLDSIYNWRTGTLPRLSALPRLARAMRLREDLLRRAYARALAKRAVDRQALKAAANF